MPPKEKQHPNFGSDAPAANDTRWNIFNAAASKPDRWWFIALMMIGIGLFLYDKYESGKERTAMRLEIAMLRDAQLKFVTDKNEIMLAAILNNTRALDATTRALERVQSKADW